MADYIPITEAQSDPEAPVDSSLIKRLRDNPIAMAGGAPGAPKVQGRALDKTYLGLLERVGSGDPIGFSDLDEIAGLSFFGFVRRGAQEIRFSSDNGASWGSFQPFSANLSLSTMQIQLNLTSGLTVFVSGRLDRDLDIIGESESRSINLSVPSGVNAFQLKNDFTGGLTGFRFNVYALGGGV